MWSAVRLWSFEQQLAWLDLVQAATQPAFQPRELAILRAGAVGPRTVQGCKHWSSNNETLQRMQACFHLCLIWAVSELDGIAVVQWLDGKKGRCRLTLVV